MSREKAWNGEGRTPYWHGSGYYVPGEEGWTHYHEYRHIPAKDKGNAILFEQESFFRSIIRHLAHVSAPGGAMFKHPCADRTSTPHEQLILQKPRAWTRPWTGAGLYMEARDTWINDQSGANVPREALLFINEEDWIKFKHAKLNPSLPRTYPTAQEPSSTGHQPLQ